MLQREGGSARSEYWIGLYLRTRLEERLGRPPLWISPRYCARLRSLLRNAKPWRLQNNNGRLDGFWNKGMLADNSLIYVRREGTEPANARFSALTFVARVIASDRALVRPVFLAAHGNIARLTVQRKHREHGSHAEEHDEKRGNDSAQSNLRLLQVSNRGNCGLGPPGALTVAA